MVAELNDDSWHRVSVSVDSLRSGRLNVSMTGSPDRSVRLITCSSGRPSTRWTEEEVRRRRREDGTGGGRGQKEEQEEQGQKEEEGVADRRPPTSAALNVSIDNDDDQFITAVISVGGY